MEISKTRTLLDKILMKQITDGLKARESEFFDYVETVKSCGFICNRELIDTYGNDLPKLRRMMDFKMREEIFSMGGFMAADGQAVDDAKRRWLNRCRKLEKALPRLHGMINVPTFWRFKANDDGNIELDSEATAEAVRKACCYKIDNSLLNEYYDRLCKLYQIQKEINQFEQKYELPYLSLLEDSARVDSPIGIGFNFRNLFEMERGGDLASIEDFTEALAPYFRLDKNRRKPFHGDAADTLKRTWQNFGWLNND